MSAHAERHVYRRVALPLAGRFAGRSVRMLRSHPKTDRGSVFVAHLAYPIHTEAEARAAIASLKRDAGHCDHAMSAWRVPAPPRNPRVGYASLRRTSRRRRFRRRRRTPRRRIHPRRAQRAKSSGRRRGGDPRVRRRQPRQSPFRTHTRTRRRSHPSRGSSIRGHGHRRRVQRRRSNPGRRPRARRGARRRSPPRERRRGGGDPGRIGTGETDEPETDEPETDEPDSETCTPRAIPNDVAEDIRRRLAEAAERRAAAANAASSIASVASVASADAVAHTNAPASPTVIHLLDDDDDAPFPRAKRSKVE